MATLGVVLGAAESAKADADVETGCALVNRGEFRDALAAFGRAEASSDLSRDDLVRLLECRALARFATRNLDALEEDLVRLVSLDPGYALSDDFGPEVHQMIDRVRARGVAALAVTVDVERRDGRIRVAARLDGDEGDLVREVRVRARVGRGAWRTGRDEVEIVGGRDATIAYVASAIGPGAAELERVEGTAGPDGSTTPRRPRRQPDDADEPASSPVIWPWLVGAGAAVAVAIGVTVAVVVSSGASDRTQPSAPIVAW